MRVQFWGTRGSLAKPGPTTLRYGGNTSCVEVRTADGTLVVLDCGTGAHDLGLKLAASTKPPLRGHLLITHTHWGHIRGFPFFAPLFARGNEWDIDAPGGLGRQLEVTLAGQMEYTYFPITLAQCGAAIRFHDLTEGRFEIGTLRVTARYSTIRRSPPVTDSRPRVSSSCTRWITSLTLVTTPVPLAATGTAPPCTERISGTWSGWPGRTW
jgi:ribonuclease BN (tRNA processing enzyme)